MIKFYQRQSTAVKLAIATISIAIFLAIMLLNLNAYLLNLPWTMNSSTNSAFFRGRNGLKEEQSEMSSGLLNTFHFQKALELQRQGLAVLRYATGRTDAKATWELIPRHFNAIWRAQLDRLDLLRLQSDSEESKFFIRFGPQLSRPYACNVITLGVGHSVWAERNLSRIYPECHFLAVDPAADVNADLVRRQLGGTFVKAAVGGETRERSLINVWEKDVELNGAQRRMVPQIGFFDFLRSQNHTLEPVDLLLVDVEGAEFGILEQLVEHPEQLPVPICQLNVELHHPNELNANYTHQRFFRYFDRLMRSGHFALLYTDINEDPRYLFLRLFLVNSVDHVCTQKFLC